MRLIEHGYVVDKPVTREVYDLRYTDPTTKVTRTAQVKTVYVRDDRDGASVVYARKSSGQPYSREEADVIIGVAGRDVYLIENRELGEYWRPRNGGANDWRLLSEQGENETEASA